MFFILSKLLLFLLSPFFWLIVSISCYYFLKNERWKKRAKYLSIGLFLFFSNSLIFSEVCGMWEISGTRMKDVKTYDVGIVLGGMSEYNNDLKELSFRRQGDRLFQALTLYHTGKVKKLLISGDSGHLTDRGLHEAKQMKDILIKWGLPKEDILTEEISKNTHENALETAKILRKDHPEITSYLLITSGIHMRRSRACFERQGLQCATFSTDLYANRTSRYHWDQYIIPNVDNFVQWHKLFKEMIGYIAYDVKGYI